MKVMFALVVALLLKRFNLKITRIKKDLLLDIRNKQSSFRPGVESTTCTKLCCQPDNTNARMSLPTQPINLALLKPLHAMRFGQ